MNPNDEILDLNDTNENYNSEVMSGGEVYEPVESISKSKISRWIIRYSGGLVKNEKQATYVSVVFVVLAITFSLFLFFSNGTKIEEKNTYNPDTAVPDRIYNTTRN